MLYVLQKNNGDCVFCSFSSGFYFIGDKIDADHFKYEIVPSVKGNGRLKFSQDVAMNRVREKEEKGCKISYKIFK